MLRLKLAYYASFGLLLALAGLTVRGCAANADTSPSPTQVQRGTVQELPDHWIVSFEVTNNSPAYLAYRVTVAIDGQDVNQSVITVKPAGRLGYFYHVLPRQITNGEVTLSLYNDTGSREIDRVTYYLLAAGAGAPGLAPS